MGEKLMSIKTIKIKTEIINWLLEGDASIQYQTHRDLLNANQELLNTLQQKIDKEGWGLRFLSRQNNNGHWGRDFYQPKWTSTHYTIMDLKNLGLRKDHKQIIQSIEMIFKENLGKQEEIKYSKSAYLKDRSGDVCINGMVLNFASYFNSDHSYLYSIVDYLLSTKMKDGGWNCEWDKGAKHSSLHTTINVLEGLLEFRNTGDQYRHDEIIKAEKEAIEFILQHQLYKSSSTGETIDKKMTRLSFPYRWRYDLLRALDYFQFANVNYDPRMDSALTILISKRHSDGKWPLQNRQPGKVHFEMESITEPSRWNTLRALRVLKYFNLLILEGMDE